MRKLLLQLGIALLTFMIGLILWGLRESYNASVKTREALQALRSGTVKQPDTRPSPLDIVDDYYKNRCWVAHPTPQDEKYLSDCRAEWEKATHIAAKGRSEDIEQLLNEICSKRLETGTSAFDSTRTCASVK